MSSDKSWWLYRPYSYPLYAFKKVTLVKLVEELKSHSSKWIKTKGNEYSNLYWQDGYGAFSVNPSEVEIVINC
jgi:hypothetical protein